MTSGSPSWLTTPATTTAPSFDATVACLQATQAWRRLTRPQRELLLSAYAGLPLLPRSDVRTRLVHAGLIHPDLTVTTAGRDLIERRLT